MIGKRRRDGVVERNPTSGKQTKSLIVRLSSDDLPAWRSKHIVFQVRTSSIYRTQARFRF